MSDASYLLRARWVFPVSSLPIEDGVVEISGGIVVRLNSGPDPAAVDLGDVAIIPGLVNAHTHLEFSHLREPLRPAAPFADWVRAVVAARHHDSEPITASLNLGIEESRTAGTTCLGEIATSPLSPQKLDLWEGRSVAFWEVLGLDDAAIDRQQAAVETHLRDAADHPDSPCIRGLSPHAPYSLHPELFRWTVDQAEAAAVPVAMHLAETRDELELLDRGTGPLVEMLRDFGVWRDGLIPTGTTVQSYLEELARLKRVLIVHGNYLTSDEIDYITDRKQFSVIYCPRTHRFFGHDEHPWRELLERGVNVAIGTDSRASNPDLSLWSELLYLRQLAGDVPPETLLRMATLNGARALGMDHLCGTIAAGRHADLAIVAFGEENRSVSAYDRLLHPESRVVRTMCPYQSSPRLFC